MLIPLLIAAVLFFCSLLSYGTAISLVVRMAVRLVRSGYQEQGFWRSTTIMANVTLIMAAAHLAQIVLWAVALLVCGQMSSFETALYFSAQNYTALGYGDIQLPAAWRLLGPFEAINGLLFFGLSTSVMFATLSRLVSGHIQAQTGLPDEPTGIPRRLSAVGNA